VGANVRIFPAPGGYLGEFLAWDPAAGKKVWGIKEPFPVWTGTLVTAGDVVFYGTMDGWFKAVNAKSGAPLWKAKLPSGSIANPITFVGPDRKQYVAIYSGIGGWFGLPIAGNLSREDPLAALGAVGAAYEAGLDKVTSVGGTLHVFALE
jgi:alcohol dehydrogenase (cytochrome c)/methanol dehydrogenase (cytochrome c) subunit 1